jgi:hypothetical protein
VEDGCDSILLGTWESVDMTWVCGTWNIVEGSLESIQELIDDGDAQ